MTHEERALQWMNSVLWEADCEHVISVAPEEIKTLAEQFREVEREVLKTAEWLRSLTPSERAEVAYYADLESVVKDGDGLRAKLREVARAGDALRTIAVELGADGLGTTIAAWDAATKGIARE